MPKLKTHRGAAKRIGFTGSGKVRRSKLYYLRGKVGKAAKVKQKLG